MIIRIKKLCTNRIILSFCIFFILIGLFLFALQITGKKTDNERIKITKAAITRAAVSCYAIEGIYPANIEYLEQNYGLSVNHDKYFVSYQVLGSNIMPDIDVFLLNGVNTYEGK